MGVRNVWDTPLKPLGVNPVHQYHWEPLNMLLREENREDQNLQKEKPWRYDVEEFLKSGILNMFVASINIILLQFNSYFYNNKTIQISQRSLVIKK